MMPGSGLAEAPPIPEPPVIGDGDRFALKRLAAGYAARGEYAQAARALAVVLATDPADAAALHLAGLVAGGQDLWEEAVALLRAALAVVPTAAMHVDLAVALNRTGQYRQALWECTKALQLDPANHRALNTMGHVLVRQQRFEMAETAFTEAVAREPRDIDSIVNLCELHLHREDRAKAIAVLEAARDTGPEWPDDLRCYLLRVRGQYAEAAEAYAAQDRERPGRLQVLIEWANALRLSSREAEAEAVLLRARALHPGHAAPHAGLAMLYRDMRRPEEACAAVELALSLAPDSPDLLFASASVQLSAGRFDKGWEAFDARLRTRHADDLQRLWGEWTPWRGEPIDGKTIIVVTEQGMGDVIQFARYLPLVARRAERLVVYAHPSLVRLLEAMPGVAEVVAFGQPIPPHDIHCHIMSLPRAFGTSLDTIPAEVPYLAPPADRVEAWRVRLAGVLADRPGLRVGVVWAGNPAFGNDHRRSMALDALSPLFQVAGTHWFSLQVGPRGRDADTLPGDRLPPGGLHALLQAPPDLVETASLVANLDLVVAVDTGVAHLAGAMARPVWLLLPAAADWRWLSTGETTRWYPTMRLFRQGADATWPPVVAAMATALRPLAEEAHGMGSTG